MATYNIDLGEYKEGIDGLYQFLRNPPPSAVDDECVAYNMKHFRIKLFQEVWNIYKKLSHEDKVRMRETILPDFTVINWITMSRLYDPIDTEFVEMFGDRINLEFAKEYNPYFQKK